MTPSGRVDAAIEAIDAANSADPHVLDVGGRPRPKELVHAERMTAWLALLDPNADDAQRLAARAHHLRRWSLPRSAFPEGRAGYLRWRAAARERHAEEFAAIAGDAGLPEALVEDAVRIIRKEGLGTDRRVQVHEDALCLTFFELQGAATVAQLGDRAPRVVERTLAKMSDGGRRLLHEAGLDPGGFDRSGPESARDAVSE